MRINSLSPGGDVIRGLSIAGWEDPQWNILTGSILPNDLALPPALAFALALLYEERVTMVLAKPVMVRGTGGI